jgi:hypothetical protein
LIGFFYFAFAIIFYTFFETSSFLRIWSPIVFFLLLTPIFCQQSYLWTQNIFNETGLVSNLEYPASVGVHWRAKSVRVDMGSAPKGARTHTERAVLCAGRVSILMKYWRKYPIFAYLLKLSRPVGVWEGGERAAWCQERSAASYDRRPFQYPRRSGICAWRAAPRMRHISAKSFHIREVQPATSPLSCTLISRRLFPIAYQSPRSSG